MIVKLARGVVASVLGVCLVCAVSAAPAAELATSEPAFVLSMSDAAMSDAAISGDAAPETEEQRRRHAVATAVAVSPDGELVAAGGDDHIVRVWDAATGKPVARLKGHDDWVRGLKISPDGAWMASVGNDGSLRFWNPNTGEPAPLERRLGRGPLADVAFHPDGRRVLTVGFRAPMQVFDLIDTDTVNDFPCPCDDTRSVAVSRDGKWAAAAGRDGRLRVWDMRTMRTLPDTPADTQRLYSVVFSPDGTTIATGGDSRVIRFWNTEDGELLGELPTGGTKIRSMLFLNSEQLAVGGVDNSINVWSISSRVPTRRMIGHTGSVAALATDAQGRLLASASYDTTVRVWRLDGNRPQTAARTTAEAFR